MLKFIDYDDKVEKPWLIMRHNDMQLSMVEHRAEYQGVAAYATFEEANKAHPDTLMSTYALLEILKSYEKVVKKGDAQ